MREWNRVLVLGVLAAPLAAQSAAPSRELGGSQGLVNGCVQAVRDDATGDCVRVSSIPQMGMLYPMGPELYINSVGSVQVANGLIAGGTLSGSFVAGDNVCGRETIYTLPGGSVGVGTSIPQADLHARSSSSVQVRLEADTDDINEFDHPLLTFSQDGGNVTAHIGYRGGTNNLRLHALNDSDMLFQLPFGGTADWEYHKSNSFGTSIDILGRLTDSGNWHVDGDYFSGGADVAEYYPVQGVVEPGDVVAFTGEGLTIAVANSDFAGRLAGIVSSDPGVVLGLSYTDEDETGVEPELADSEKYQWDFEGRRTDRAILHEIHVNGRAPLALTGRVPCKVSAENGPIEVGDMLTVASLPGHAAKAVESGPVIGTAIESWEHGVGTILVLANLGWFTPDTADMIQRLAEVEARLAEVKARLHSLGR